MAYLNAKAELNHRAAVKKRRVHWAECCLCLHRVGLGCRTIAKQFKTSGRQVARVCRRNGEVRHPEKHRAAVNPPKIQKTYAREIRHSVMSDIAEDALHWQKYETLIRLHFYF